MQKRLHRFREIVAGLGSIVNSRVSHSRGAKKPIDAPRRPRVEASQEKSFPASPLVEGTAVSVQEVWINKTEGGADKQEAGDEVAERAAQEGAGVAGKDETELVQLA